MSYSDPYGLKIECLTQAACDLWNEMHTRVNEGLRSRDERVRIGAQKLRDIMNDAYNDTSYTYRIEVSDFTDDWGGGKEDEMEDGKGFVVRVDSNPGPEVARARWIDLAHELGGAQGERHGKAHWRGSLAGENAARRIAGCSLRHFEARTWLNPGCR